MTESVEKIRHLIMQEVFVRRGQERFVPDGSWIMDFRRICLDPEFLDAYTEIFYERFKDRYPFQVGGAEVAAIPLVAAIIMKMREKGLSVNGFFIRKSRKKTGLLKMIEGKLTDDPVILVDDLINNGYTLDRQLKVMAEAGKKTVAFFAILRFRKLEAYKEYSDRGVVVDTLFHLDDFRETLGTSLMEREGEKIVQENFTVKWYCKIPGAKLEVVTPKSGAVFDDDRVYAGSDQGVFFALDRKDGSVVWRHRVGLGPWGSKRDKEIFSTPVLHLGRVYFGAYDGNIYCLEAATGKRLFVSFEADWIAGGLALSSEKNALYIPTTFGLFGKEGGLTALHIVTGKVLWRKRFSGAIQSAPCIAPEQKKIFFGGEDGMLQALDMNNGRVVWTFQSNGAIKDTPTYDRTSSSVFFSSFDGRVYRLDAQTGLLIWKYDIGLANYSSPYVWRDRVFVCSLDKNLYSLDLETGQKQWIFPARSRIFSRPRVYHDRLYFGANDARLYEVDPISGKQRGFFQVVERITNPLLFDEKTGTFFLQTYANEIYCLLRK